jgi:tetratricopeptide (TPR) repeat protein
MKALARLPADRFSTAAAFAEGLLESPPVTGIQEGTRKRTQGTRRWVASGFGLALAVSVAATLVLKSGTDLPFDKRDWILITDFENETGDAAFDRSLYAALNIAIQQSGHVNVVQRARMAETLQMMQRDDVETIDEPLAREIAIRNNVPVVITPSITRLDSVYTLAYRAVDPTTGSVMRTRSFRGTSRAQILESLDDLARRLRRDLGESWLAVARQGTPVALATTPSLEALVVYTEAGRQFNSRNYEEARPMYERAIELDSNFAMAHAGLGMFFLLVESDRVNGDEHLNKALALSDRLTDRERLVIEADGHFFKDNFERAISAYKIYTALYPDDVSPKSNLGLAYMQLNLYDEAISTLKQLIRQDSADAGAYINLATSFSASDEPDSALQYYHQGFALRPEWRLSGNLNHEFGFTYAEAGNLDAAEQTFTDMLSGSNDQQASGARSLGLLKMYEGKYHEAIDQLKRAAITTQLLDYPTSELRNHLYLATVFRALGDAENYLQELSEAHRIGISQPIAPVWIGRLAKLYLRSGLTTEAQVILDTLEARRDTTNRVDKVFFHLLSGEAALAAEQYAEATQQLEMAHTLQADTYTLESLAYGYMMGGDLEAARAKYEELISHRQLGWEGQEYWTLAHYELGGIYEALGDTTRAIEYYDRFLNIWRDGDDELLALMGARIRLQALSGPG